MNTTTVQIKVSYTFRLTITFESGKTIERDFDTSAAVATFIDGINVGRQVLEWATLHTSQLRNVHEDRNDPTTPITGYVCVGASISFLDAVEQSTHIDDPADIPMLGIVGEEEHDV